MAYETSLDRAFLIDGTASCYRAFYAIRHLSTSGGRPTNAVYGFVMMLQALLQKERPQYLAVAFDAGKPTFRHEQFKAYKVQRKPMPELLIGQLPQIKAVLAAYRIPVFQREGYEGEDVLATIAKQIVSEQVEVLLVTGDKDALQLVNEHIKVYNPQQDGAIIDAAAVQARYGIMPERMVDLMALIGDAVDNIPGVPGIGEKTAVQLLQRFGGLDRLYERLDEVESAVKRNSLAEARTQVELSRELVKVRTDVPSLTVPLEELRVQEPDWRQLRRLFRELEFTKLLRTIDGHASPDSGAMRVVTHRATTDEELRALAAELMARDTEPTAFACWPNDAAWLAGVSFHPGEAWLVPMDAARLATPAGQAFAAWLAHGPSPKITHDAKSLMRRLRAYGCSLRGVAGDTMVAAYLLNPARTNQTLSDLSDEYLDEPLPSPETRSGDLAAVQDEPYGAALCAMGRLHARLLAVLESQSLLALYRELELPLVGILAGMEAHGLAVDLPHLHGLRVSMQAELDRLTEEIHAIAGQPFNLNSPKQLAQVLFERLQLPVIKRNKSGPSTDSDVLQQLADRHPLPARLMQYRERSKLVSTYVEALPALVDPRTGRLHTSFNQTATATGRLSSSEPNLQNIPIKTELGRQIRRAFIPGIPDGMLLAADYSQIELRILAHLSQDALLADAFRQDRDIHRFTASMIYGCPEAEVQPEQRYAMKAVNYGILYGMSAHGLSRELGVSFEEAQAFIQAYFERYPSVQDYLKRQIEAARRDGFVQTLLGRRRYIPEVSSPDPAVRQFGERMAVNAPIQGTAADLIKRAMVMVSARLQDRRLESRMVLQVHDELIFEAPRGEVPVLAAVVRETMEHAMSLSVPLQVTVKTGPNWLDLVNVTQKS